MDADRFDAAALAGVLDQAAQSRFPLTSLAELGGVDDRSAYTVQKALIERRLARGERLIGLKMGFTSEAMRQQMGVARPNCGWLTDAMLVPSGRSLSMGGCIHPRAEPEVAIRLGRDLGVDACAAAIEVVDSRFRDYRFTWAENTADNSSACGLALGPWRAWPMELADREVRLRVDGECVERGTTMAVMGHPLKSLTEAVRLAIELGRPLQPGMIVLTGGVTAAPYLRPGRRIVAEVDGLDDAVLDVGD